MGDIPVLKPREVKSILEKMGFLKVRQKGSHMQFKHSDYRFTTVPFHPGKDISPPLLRQICKDIDITLDEFLSYRK